MAHIQYVGVISWPPFSSVFSFRYDGALMSPTDLFSVFTYGEKSSLPGAEGGFMGRAERRQRNICRLMKLKRGRCCLFHFVRADFIPQELDVVPNIPLAGKKGAHFGSFVRRRVRSATNFRKPLIDCIIASSDGVTRGPVNNVSQLSSRVPTRSPVLYRRVRKFVLHSSCFQFPRRDAHPTRSSSSLYACADRGIMATWVT